MLLWQMIHNQWSETPARERRQLTKPLIEDKAEVTSLACFLPNVFFFFLGFPQPAFQKKHRTFLHD